MLGPYRYISAVLRPDRPNPLRSSGGPISLPRFFVGVDLGQARDHTAIAVTERVPLNSLAGELASYHVRHLDRVPLGVSYPRIAEGVAELVQNPELAGDYALIVDATGVGRSVMDLLVLSGLRPIAVTATGGKRVTGGRTSVNVPKRDLAMNLQVILQGKRLRIADTLRHAETLLEELRAFRVRITAAGNAQFGAWGEGEHDDLAFALALALWWPERRNRTRSVSSQVLPEGPASSS